MNTRRHWLIALAAGGFTPWALLAQSKQAPVLIGWLNMGSRESSGQFLVALKEGLAALGWKDGPQFVIEERWADGRRDRAQPLAEELVAKKPKLIVVASLPAAAAMAKAAPKIPIVIASGGDPVAGGIVKSLARPGGMITGLTNVRSDLTEKLLELLLAAVPKLRRVGFLADPNSANHLGIVDAARRSVARFSVEARFADVARLEELEPAIARLAKEGAQALVVLSGAAFTVERWRIARLALAHRWPVIAGDTEFADAGMLLSYGIDVSQNFRRAAYYVDRILKGDKPGDLPIEQPTRFELVVNLKTAKALGLTLPQPFLMRADRVIE